LTLKQNDILKLQVTGLLILMKKIKSDMVVAFYTGFIEEKDMVAKAAFKNILNFPIS